RRPARLVYPVDCSRAHAVMPRPFRWLLVALSALGAPLSGAAQVGTTTDTITGSVTGPDSQPLPGAVVQATSLETHVSRPPTSDLNTLATLAPGVVGIGETDSTSGAFSVAGQRSTANTITLDGLSFGSGNVPQDALRTTRVVTSTYDVARGQFSGGLVASTTRSGTNVPQGSFTYALRDRD